ncbi:tlde1 domain-containing protein [Paraburkholderia antibiotica]|uniref:DUF2778 domain-containing protein n=1 Tax=Paraburkholderia antibiotica TaxID=2728839 RepID=A0A7X9ZWJ6_9BURK|nr:tlde1 domain-containing protein [Paraburkholderia antibiotica]NML30786.1 DUF2778 domain-containing protein [Paraburkholderia antibiotica]
MPWVYDQSSGRLSRGSATYQHGYSGRGTGKNNPAMQGMPSMGPIPRGTYSIGAPFTHPHAGTYAMRLTPGSGTYTYGRSGFMIHGDSIAHPGSASDGCVIERMEIRRQIWSSGDHTLEVR